jgi:4-hydroxy-tetrahydrodipicolinate reductase
MTLRVGVNGACGRMGARIVQIAHDDPEVQVAAALEWHGHPKLGQDVGEAVGIGKIGTPITAGLRPPLDAVIDFSTPDGVAAIVTACVEHRIPLVVATTGLTAEQRASVESAAAWIPVLVAPNMSLAVNLLFKLVGAAAAALRDADADIEILERHHRFKKDAPSGTALEFARVISRAAGERRLVHGREGITGERRRDEIGVHAIRVSDNVGEHTIVFSLMGETIEFTHRGHSRDCYARGAIRAAKHVARRPPGLYGMFDVLGL